MSASRTSVLPAGYTMHVDTVGKDGWHDVLDRLADANIYQSWPYESIRSGDRNASHLLLSRNGEVVAATQVKIVKVPFVKLGFAYVRWGPMWKLRGHESNPEVLAVALDCIRHEYAVRRGLSVRILPYLLNDEHDTFDPLLGASDFDRLSTEAPQRTLLMSLEYSLPDLRARLDQKWRNCLNRAEKNDLVIEQGTADDLFERFIGIHAEMRDRKGFVATSDVNEFRAIQRDLPQRHKMQLFLASTQGQLAAGVVCSKIGDFGVFLHGATSDVGRHTNASYLLQWRALAWLKENAAASYNLHGINPVMNPGTYRFKAGLCGRSGRDLHYLGAYESGAAVTSQVLVGLANSVRRVYRHSRTAVRQLYLGASR